MLGLQNEREWKVFCEKVLEDPALGADPRYDGNSKRNACRDELLAIFKRVFESLTAAALVARLDAAGVANARINMPDEVWNHPQFKARGRWREFGSPAGPLPATLPPATLSGTEVRMDPMPGVGEHSEAILAELGYGTKDIAQLRAARAI